MDDARGSAARFAALAIDAPHRVHVMRPPVQPPLPNLQHVAATTGGGGLSAAPQSTPSRPDSHEAPAKDVSIALAEEDGTNKSVGARSSSPSVARSDGGLGPDHGANASSESNKSKAEQLAPGAASDGHSSRASSPAPKRRKSYGRWQVVPPRPVSPSPSERTLRAEALCLLRDLNSLSVLRQSRCRHPE